MPPFFVAILISILFLIIVFSLFGLLFFQIAFSTKKRRPLWDEPYLKARFIEGNYDPIRSWHLRQDFENLDLKSFDGLILRARRLDAKSKHSVILVHGYRSNSNRLLEWARYYYENYHYNVLLIDLRGHGASDGTTVGMGFLDCLDLRQWTLLESKRIGESGSLILHGLSMGAATVLNLSNQHLPACVRFLVADSAFTEAQQELLYKLKHTFHLPAFPIYQIAALFYRMKVGYALKFSCPLERVAHSRYPILYIHGADDDYVPLSMAMALYETTQSEKALHIVPGATHTFAYRIDPIAYFAHIEIMIKKYIPNSIMLENLL